MRMIFKNLGFTKERIMEKYRQKWQLGNAEIAIDKLPMGAFLEVEGKEKDINKVVKILGLNFQERIIGTYWDLWKEFCRRKGISSKNIVFS